MKLRRVLSLVVVSILILSGCVKEKDNLVVEVDEAKNQVVEPIVDLSDTEEKEEIVKTKEDTEEKENETEEVEVTLESEASELNERVPVISGWDYVYEDFSLSMPYEAPIVNAVSQGIGIKDQFQSIVNANQFTGFTEGQLAMLENNGFAVMQPSSTWPIKKLHFSYEGAAYSDIPTIVTSDAVLNMYHLFYSESMKSLEANTYYDHLMAMSDRMLFQASDHYETLSEESAEVFKDVFAYIVVGNQLLRMSDETDASKVFVPEEVQVLVDAELVSIGSESLAYSNLFDKDLDYSQFIVRGHYDVHEQLQHYFKGMMWYSYGSFQISEGFGQDMVVLQGQLSASLMLTHLIFEDVENVKDWSMIYRMTGLYSGLTDDVTPFELRDLIQTIYGENPSLEAYMEVSSDAMLTELLTLRGPEIMANIDENSLLDIPEGLQCQLMGQRYSLDGNIMQELMKPILRPMPTAFDVLSAFGHPVAEEVLYTYYPTNQNWDEYDVTLANMKDLTGTYDGWQDNLYNGWLWSIDAAAQSFEDYENYPELMTSRAWSHKNIATALGSYAELKHNNILYNLQPMAEAGGMTDENVHYYVEPNVELYARLLWLISYTKLNLEAVYDSDHEAIYLLTQMEEMLEVFVAVSIKELEGRTVTNEEFSAIRYFGGLVDYVNVAFAYIMDSEIGFPPVDSSALVADIASSSGSYREVACGMPREIYVVCYVNDKSFIARGSVYSAYEFVSDQRLTDGEWSEMIGLEKVDDYWVEYKGSDLDQLEMMPWMADFISPEPNNVTFEYIEVNWVSE